MTLLSCLSLFGIMIVLAAIPSASVALVVTRSATRGIPNGIAVAAGIVIGDLIFVVLAILGMTALAESLGSFFFIIRLLAGAYLIWMGIALIRSKSTMSLDSGPTQASALGNSFAAGLLLTLGDVKAIVFYASLFPAFVDLKALTGSNIVATTFITVVAVGGVKTLYAFAATRIWRRLQERKLDRKGQIIAGCAMTGTGCYLLAKP